MRLFGSLTRRVIIAGLFLIGAIMVSPTVSYAQYNPLNEACKGNSNSPSCKASSRTTKNPITGDNGLILSVANILSVFAAISAVIVMIISGMRMISASGDSQAISKAKKAVLAAAIGLVVIILARSIIAFVVGGL